jgi:hypothetical protein
MKRTRKKKVASAHRALPALERLLLEGNPIRRRLLENQGSRPAVGTSRFPPGIVISVQFAGCAHRARVEALAAGSSRSGRGALPATARAAPPNTARSPVRNATREVVRERVEMREGRKFQVQVMKTPRRARKR